jgi:hypothetical protein
VTERPPLAKPALVDPFKADVLRRLQIIEHRLGLSSGQFPGNLLIASPSGSTTTIGLPGREHSAEEDEQYVAGLPDVRAALQILIASSLDTDNEGWSPRVVEALWLA